MPVFQRKGAVRARQWDGSWKSAIDVIDLMAEEFCGGVYGDGQVTINPAGDPPAPGGGLLNGSWTTVYPADQGGGGTSHFLSRDMYATDWVVVYGDGREARVVADADFDGFWETVR